MTVFFALVFAMLSAVGARLLSPPLGLDIYMPVPETNALTREKVVLGRKLFFDKRLSRDGMLACASCHDPKNLARFPSLGLDSWSI